MEVGGLTSQRRAEDPSPSVNIDIIFHVQNEMPSIQNPVLSIRYSVSGLIAFGRLPVVGEDRMQGTTYDLRDTILRRKPLLDCPQLFDHGK